MQPRDPAYWYECAHCGFLCSTLEPAIGDVNRHSAIDEPSRRHALQALRNESFERVIDALWRVRGGQTGTLLDVGCAHGWFLEAASQRGFRVTGIEPDAAIAAQARQTGLSVVPGYFPEVLPADATFDIITFNDVFEHLSDPHSAARACFRHLRPDGHLAITIPSSKGSLFRAARVLARLGFTGPLDRLWQRGFPSPHLSYFHPDGLATLLAQHGFRELLRASLPSFYLAGLWQRIRFNRTSSLPVSAAQYLGLTLLSPVLTLAPSDISFQVFERCGSTEPTNP